MKFSEKWLREWVNPPVDTETLSEQLTMAGLEVEGITPCLPDFSGVVVARVLRVDKHPAANKLSVCRVDDGTQVVQVVCGAANVQVDGVYPFARIAATLPGGVKIKKTSIKNEDSHGMLCSGAELGLTDDADIIMNLDTDAVPGTPLEEYLGLDDRIIELSLTPNRGDCLSIRGIAREVAVINKLPVTPVAGNPVAPATQQTCKVELAAPQACPHYAGRVISGVDLGRPSPLWLQEKLRRSDIRSINIIVDVTNFVMLELGQPMHAFDLDLLDGGITVRYARDGEQITTLDGAVITLSKDTLVIADDTRAVAVAGIMGGLGTGVTQATENIFLESAFFTPETIMGKPRRYGLYSDSSHRFERGVDFQLQLIAIERASELILELCGGTAGPVIDVADPDHLPGLNTVTLRSERIGRLLGTGIEQSRVKDILQRLGMTVIDLTDGWEVQSPSFRFDISIEADLIEEIARVHGYDNIPSAPIDARLRIERRKKNRDINELRQILVNRGYHEAITYSFIDAELQNLICAEAASAITLVNPISSELAVLRQNLWPGLLGALLYNLKRQQQRVRLYEYGRVFRRRNEEIIQELKLAGLIYGNTYNIQWDISNSTCDFYDLKGDLEALLGAGDPKQHLDYRALSHPALHPGRSAEILYKKQLVGLFGAIHPRILAKLGIAQPVYVFQLDCPAILEKERIIYKNISKYPMVRRDISILVDEEIPLKNIEETIKSASPKLLNNLELFDVYHGEGIELMKKSLALGLTFQASSNTLTDEAVEGEVANILTALKSRFEIKLRE